MKTKEQWQKYTQNALEKVRDERQQHTLRRFLKSLSNTIARTRYIYIQRLMKLGTRINKPYEEMNNEDLCDFFYSIDKDGTYNSYLQTIKKFFEWLGKKETVQNLKQRKTDISISPSELLTTEDVISLASATGSLMWKTLILTLFESAARVSEILSLKVGDVEFHRVKAKDGKPGLVATLYFKRSKGKVKKEPVALSIFSIELKKWLEEHPHKQNPNALLFYSQKYDLKAEETLDITTVRTMLLKAKKITNIKKKVNPHWFRHSMLSYCVNVLGYNEQLLMWRAGWKNTAMAKRYVHSGARLQNSAYLRKLGYVVEEEDIEKPPPLKVCPHCGSISAQTNRLCDTCGMPLDLEKYREVVGSRKKLQEKIEQQAQQIEDIRNELRIRKLATDKIAEEWKDEIMKLRSELHMYEEMDMQDQDREMQEEYSKDPEAFMKKYGLTKEEEEKLQKETWEYLKRQPIFWEWVKSGAIRMMLPYLQKLAKEWMEREKLDERKKKLARARLF